MLFLHVDLFGFVLFGIFCSSCAPCLSLSMLGRLSAVTLLNKLPSLFSLLLLGPFNADVSVLDMVPVAPETIFVLFSLFSLPWMISITLSSSYFSHSSVASNQLLIPSSVFFYFSYCIFQSLVPLYIFSNSLLKIPTVFVHSSEFVGHLCDHYSNSLSCSLRYLHFI